MNAYQYVTKENLLDWIESHGRNMYSLTFASAHPYDDKHRAKPYVAKHRAAQRAWHELKHSDIDPLVVIRKLLKSTSGIDGNHVSLMECALRGQFEWTDDMFKRKYDGKYNHHWVTYHGDLYSINSGDHLNIPRVHRIANEYMPEERQKLDGAREIAALMPNPCTRVRVPIQVS